MGSLRKGPASTRRARSLRAPEGQERDSASLSGGGGACREGRRWSREGCAWGSRWHGLQPLEGGGSSHRAPRTWGRQRAAGVSQSSQRLCMSRSGRACGEEKTEQRSHMEDAANCVDGSGDQGSSGHLCGCQCGYRGPTPCLASW